eukprot:scaffold77112_cov18-Tisochrysis_lutea.AAC.1
MYTTKHVPELPAACKQPSMYKCKQGRDALNKGESVLDRNSARRHAGKLEKMGLNGPSGTSRAQASAGHTTIGPGILMLAFATRCALPPPQRFLPNPLLNCDCAYRSLT